MFRWTNHHNSIFAGAWLHAGGGAVCNPRAKAGGAGSLSRRPQPAPEVRHAA